MFCIDLNGSKFYQKTLRWFYNRLSLKDFIRFRLKKFYIEYKPFRPYDNLDSNKKLNLIYTVAVGKIFAEYAEMLCDTLRNEGKYDGEIIVFTENKNNFSKNFKEKIEVVNFPLHPSGWRILVWKKIEAEKYNQIMYLDTDILCVNPIRKLFNAFGCIRFYLETFKEKRAEFEIYEWMEKWHSRNALQKEKKAFGKWGINAGQYCIDASLFNNFMEQWEKLYLPKANDWWANDQASLNLLIRRNWFPNYPWNKESVNLFGLDDYCENPTLFHFSLIESKKYLLENYQILVKNRKN